MIEGARSTYLGGQVGYVAQAEYDKINQKNSRNEEKLKSLYEALADKEFEIRKAREREENYEASYRRLHKQMAGFLRASSTSIGNKCPKCGYENVKKTGQSTTTYHDKSLLPEATNSPCSHVTVKLQARGSNPEDDSVVPSSKSPSDDWKNSVQSKLSIDGAACTPSVPLRIQSASANLKPCPSILPEEESSLDQKTKPSQTTVPAETQVDPQSAEPSVQKVPKSINTIKAPVDLRKDLFKAPEVSRLQFDRLATENVRMKHALMKLEKEEKIDIYSYMTCLEFERVNRQLREELKRSKCNTEEITKVLLMQSGQDERGLAEKLVQYQRQVTQLTEKLTSEHSELEKVRERLADLQQKAQKLQEAGTCCKVDEGSEDSSGLDDTETRTEDSCSLTTPTAKSSDRSVSVEEVEEQKKEISNLQSQVAQLRAQSEKDQKVLEKEISNLRLTVDDLNQKLTKADQENKYLHNKCENLTESLQTKLSQVHPQEESSGQIDSKMEKMRQDLMETQEQKDLLLIQITDLERRLVGLNADREARHQQEQVIQDQKLQIASLRSQGGGHRSASLGYVSGGSTRSPGPSIPEEGYSSLSSSDSASYRHAAPPSRSSYTSAGSSGFSSGYGSGYSSGASVRSEVSPPPSGHNYTCQRCLEEFKIFEKDKYDEHLKKCVV